MKIGEEPRQLAILAERMDRLHDARPRHERSEDRQEERHDDERDVPDAQHAAPFLHHHRMQERGRREPRQQARRSRPDPTSSSRPSRAPRTPRACRASARTRASASRSWSSADTARSHASSRWPVISAAMPNANGIVMATKPDVQRRRVNRHVEVLEQRASAPARQPARRSGRSRTDCCEPPSGR